MAPVQVATLVGSASLRALLCFAWRGLATLTSSTSLARLAGFAPWRSCSALARLPLRWTPRYLLGATLEKEVAAAVLLQLAHQRSGIAYIYIYGACVHNHACGVSCIASHSRPFIR